jgi:phospholipase C
MRRRVLVIGEQHRFIGQCATRENVNKGGKMPNSLDKVDTFVIVILENRSFDHMLGYLNLPGPQHLDVEGLRDDPNWLQQCANSGIQPHKFDVQVIEDPPHEKATIALQLGIPPTQGGRCPMNGFVESYKGAKPPPTDPGLVMGYYGLESVPTFDFLAHNYMVCDHWFASLPTGTQANRLMAMSGTTSLVDNASLFLPDQPLVYDWLTEHGVAWCAYQSGDFLPFFALMPKWQDIIANSLALDFLVAHAHPKFRRFSNFLRDWTTEQDMPPVIFIEPEYTDGPHWDPNDDHPPTGVAAGQKLVADIYAALIANPTRWARTALIVTYDEHGGFYDHVPPLNIPTSLLGHGLTSVFTTTGPRVPALIVSPLVEPGSVHRGMLDHTSILQLLADKFANGFYSGWVGNRQPALSRLADVFTRSEPRIDNPVSPSVTSAAPSTRQAPLRAPGANANAQAFQLAATKILRENKGIASGLPELAKAVSG